jgi:16S rRNA (cytosine1402-N4)-methyltransferase
MNNLHTPVLLNETIQMLNINKNGVYVDCTGGRGGHSEVILQNLEKGQLICIDTDIDAINFLRQKFKNAKQIIIVHGKFSNIDTILKQINVAKVDGILLDLGVSSPMFDDPSRGFSYHHDGQLDMRMNQQQELNAQYVINNYNEKELAKIFKTYGEIANPHYVVKKIIETRKIKPIATTIELVEIIKSCVSFKDLKKIQHPARKYFQALRIYVNNEISELEILLEKAPNLLNKKGTLVVITFHSIEDRIVKHTFRK